MARKLSARGLKILKLIHLLLASTWLGGAVIMTLLLIVGRPTNAHEMYMRSLDLQYVDYMIVTTSAIALVLTGIVYGVWTKWGFFKHRWITLKWILTVLMIMSGTFIMGPSVDGNVYAPELVDTYSPTNPEFLGNVATNLRWGWIQLAAFLAIFLLSVFKPKFKK